MNEPCLTLWGKTSADKLHPLLFHLLDAGHAAAELWKVAFPVALKDDLAAMVGLDQTAAGRLIAFWTALHDLGKASPAFQRKYEPAVALLMAEGFPFPKMLAARPHGLVTGWSLCRDAFEDGMNEDEREALGRALSGHHGNWPDSDIFEDPARTENLGGQVWRDARRAIFATLRQVFEPPANFSFPPDGLQRNIFLTLLSGLVSVADWLASNQHHFPAAGLGLDLTQYRRDSADNARQSVEEQGWLMVNDRGEDLPLRFEEVFPHILQPRPVQSAVFERAFGAALPALALIEAPTGIGKTEIALMLADTWLGRSGGRGIYVAMPTQATSNQMYGRTSQFLTSRYKDQKVHLHLVHGHALLQDHFEKTVIASVGEEKSLGVAAASWFLPRKRTLLAPNGVGTVDQIFLSVLQTRHFFVRLFGLYGKVVIFDEVHAYDAYQSALFERLLQWLRALKVSVVLLSATLPAQVRSQMAAAYGGKGTVLPEGGGYPRLTLVGPDGASVHSLPESPSTAVSLDWLGDSPGDIVDYLREKLAEGGCAAVICNTVARAQEIYRAVQEAHLAPGMEILFHARFPFAWREILENQVLGNFGPPEGSMRPWRAVVVATQVIEQSLDLDFDIMLSELAPIDLLIQRAGRLHRHVRESRPGPLAAKTLALMQAQRRDGDPDFGPSCYVYGEYRLLRTAAVLRGRTELVLPAETPMLIEAVYADLVPDAGADGAGRLAKAKAEMEAEIRSSIQEAKKRLVRAPAMDDLLTQRSEDLMEEENPALHTAFMALTRESPPGVSLVCLHRLPDGRTALEPGQPETVVDVGCEPKNQEEIKELLRHVVQVQRPELVQYFAGSGGHQPWKENAALRFHHPVVFEDGVIRFDGLKVFLTLDRELGLAFEKEVS